MNCSIKPTCYVLYGFTFLFLLFACAPSKPTPKVSQVARTPSSSGEYVFSRADQGKTGIYITSTYLNSIQTLTDLPDSTCPMFSPDGQYLAFCSKQNEKNSLFIMGDNGANPHQLTDQIQGCSCSPDAPLSWSPDGNWILLPVSGEDKSQPTYDLYVVSADGSQVVNLTSSPQRYGGLVWDPDSRSILFTGMVGEKPDIYQVNINTKKIAPLSSKPISGAAAGWSPDGSKLLIFADSGGGNFDIFLLSRGSDELIRLTDSPGFDSYPHWFPDGQNILYISTRDGNNEIYRMNADGSDQKNLTQNPDALDIWPSISLDGKKIIYLTGSNNQWDSWMMNTDGSNRTKMTDLIGIPSTITWKP